MNYNDSKLLNSRRSFPFNTQPNFVISKEGVGLKLPIGLDAAIDCFIDKVNDCLLLLINYCCGFYSLA